MLNSVVPTLGDAVQEIVGKKVVVMLAGTVFSHDCAVCISRFMIRNVDEYIAGVKPVPDAEHYQYVGNGCMRHRDYFTYFRLNGSENVAGDYPLDRSAYVLPCGLVLFVAMHGDFLCDPNNPDCIRVQNVSSALVHGGAIKLYPDGASKLPPGVGNVRMLSVPSDDIILLVPQLGDDGELVYIDFRLVLGMFR